MTENIKCPCCGSEDVMLETFDGYYNNGSCLDCGCEWDENRRQPPNAWVEWGERPPDRGASVLIYSPAGRIEKDTYISELCGFASFWANNNVTHWHSLPKPPKPPVTRKAGE